LRLNYFRDLNGYLSLRTGKIYIQDTLVEIPSNETELYIDLECHPDEEFFYLFGIIVQQAENVTKYQFWADTVTEEVTAWHEFISIIDQHCNSPLFHYGSFEKKSIIKLGGIYFKFQGNNGIKPFLTRLFE